MGSHSSDELPGHDFSSDDELRKGPIGDAAPTDPARKQPDNGPITPAMLGLPKEYDHGRDAKYVPTQADLRAAAVRALDDRTAFVLLHRDTPALIVEHIDSIASIALAASQIPGDHQAKAIRLGLALEPQYWFGANRINDWLGLILPLLGTALAIGDRGLQSEIYRAWGVYLTITQNHTGSGSALEKALGYADDSGREDLRVLARAERFNMAVDTMSLDNARREAESILKDARRLNFAYAKGRVYLSLARAYNNRMQHEQTFECAQQAMLLLAHLEVHNLAGQAINMMVSGLLSSRQRLSAYRRKLLTLMMATAEYSADPFFQSAACHQLAAESFYDRQYDSARAYALQAWSRYRRILRYDKRSVHRDNCASIKQILGMIQTKRHAWRLAALHLTAAYHYAVARKQHALSVNAYYALAFIPLEQGDYPEARALLLETLRQAENLPDEPVRQSVTAQIRANIADVEQRLKETG